MEGWSFSSAKDIIVPVPFLVRGCVLAAGTRTMALNDNGIKHVLADNDASLPTVIKPLFPGGTENPKGRLTMKKRIVAR